MEGIAVNAYRKVKRMSRRRRGYKRLIIRTTNDPTNHLLRPPNRRLCRIKISPKLRLMNNLLSKLRDAYVTFMLSLSASPFFSRACCCYGSVDYGVGGFGTRPVNNKDYDEKVIIEIYNSLVRSRHQLAFRPDDPSDDNKPSPICLDTNGPL